MKNVFQFFGIATTIILYSSGAIGQNDTLISYNVRTRTITILPPVDDDHLFGLDSTSAFQGAFENAIQLPDDLPGENLYDHSLFTRLTPADHFFDVTSYPIRTAIRMFRYQNDSLKGSCSGIMVSDNMVLTAAHCVFWDRFIKDEFNNLISVKTWAGDSLFVSPAYNNGKNQAELPNSYVKKYYIFKNYYDEVYFEDIALLELNNPIGRQLGWVGITYIVDTLRLRNKIFHKLSYPRTVNPFDSSEVYNGDTLYYNFGRVDFSAYSKQGMLEVKNVSGIPGQSGSSLFFESNGGYYSIGVLNFSNNLVHQGITRSIYYQLKNVIEKNSPVQTYIEDDAITALVYPNPVSRFGVFTFGKTNEMPLNLEIYNSCGQLILIKKAIQSPSIRIDRNELQRGIHFFSVSIDNKVLYKGKFMVL